MSNLILGNINLLKLSNVTVRKNEQGIDEICIPVNSNNMYYVENRCAYLALSLTPNKAMQERGDTHFIKIGKPKNMSKKEYLNYPIIGGAKEFIFEDTTPQASAKNDIQGKAVNNSNLDDNFGDLPF